MFKKIVFAGVAGLACGKFFTLGRQHTDAVLPIVQCSAAAGVIGGLVGWGVAAYRNHPTHIYCISLGANFALGSGLFLGIRQVIFDQITTPTQQPRPLPISHDVRGAWLWAGSEQSTAYASSMASGAVTAALLSVLSGRGLRSVATTTVGGVAVGVCAQLLYDRFEVWRKRKAIELHYPHLTRGGGQQEEEEWTWDSVQSRFIQFWHQQSRSSEMSARLSQLEEAIAVEERKIAELERELGERGVDQEERVEGKEVEPSDSYRTNTRVVQR